MNGIQRITKPKTNYEVPTIDVIEFPCADILSVSGNGDPNQGEWDPQPNGIVF